MAAKRELKDVVRVWRTSYEPEIELCELLMKTINGWQGGKQRAFNRKSKEVDIALERLETWDDSGYMLDWNGRDVPEHLTHEWRYKYLDIVEAGRKKEQDCMDDLKSLADKYRNMVAPYEWKVCYQNESKASNEEKEDIS